MLKKFFAFDKNYLLEQAQLSLEEELLRQLVKNAIEAYEYKMNPLGLLDSFSTKIRNHKPSNLSYLHGFYEKLSAIYRFKSGNNQLEFLWDGAEHIDYYKKAWTDVFEKWTQQFLQQDLFVQAVLDLSVFLPDDGYAPLIENRMHHFIEKNMEVKFHKTKGLQVA